MPERRTGVRASERYVVRPIRDFENRVAIYIEAVDLVPLSREWKRDFAKIANHVWSRKEFVKWRLDLLTEREAKQGKSEDVK